MSKRLWGKITEMFHKVMMSNNNQSIKRMRVLIHSTPDLLVPGRSDGADAGGQSRQDGHGAGAAGPRGRRQRPGRRGLHGADVRQRARPRGDRQAAARPARLRRHAQRQRESH